MTYPPELEQAVAERLCGALLREDKEKYPKRWEDFDIQSEITPQWLAVAREALAMCERVGRNVWKVTGASVQPETMPIDLTPVVEERR